MEIIKDIRGGTLRLSKTRLTEITGCVHSYEQWFLTLKNLKSTPKITSREWQRDSVRVWLRQHTIS